MYVAIDDASPTGCAQVLPNERAEIAVGFLSAAVAYCSALGVVICEVLTDNSACHLYRTFSAACRGLG